MPRKVFVAGEILTAADVNTNLADQAVMTFAGTAARGSAIGTAVEGMVTYLEDTDQLEVYGGTAVGWSSASNFLFGTATPSEGQVATFSTAVSGYVPADAPSGKILEVVSTTKTDAQVNSSVSSGTYVNASGLQISHAVSDASNKVILIGQLSGEIQGVLTLSGAITANGTAIALGDAAGSRTRVAGMQATVSANFQSTTTIIGEYTPGTTSSIDYDLAVINMRNGGADIVINRSLDDSDQADRTRSVSTLTLMEVAG